MEFTGKIIAVMPPRTGTSKSTGNEWKVQEYVIESHDQYPKKMCFEVFGTDKIAQLNIQMGEELTVSFDIDARQWQDRWFNSVRVWAVNRNAMQPAAPAATDFATAAPFPPAQPGAASDDPFAAGSNTDDLPFS